ncbi:MAG: (Fe-S)-binding protein [Elusimicrobiales bacterium]
MRLPKIDDFVPYNELYTAATEGAHLKTLLTVSGEKPVYDCAVKCNRCGLCLEKCPTYSGTGAENFSPRGRAQLLRMAMGGRLKLDADAAVLAESFYNCLLCGACSGACHSQVPVRELALEGRRTYPEKGAGALARAVFACAARRPALARALMRALSAARGAGLVRLLSAAGALDTADAQWAARWDRLHPRRVRFLDETAAAAPELKRAGQTGRSGCVCFIGCQANYLYPKEGMSVIRLADRFIGPVRLLGGLCCGLNSYLFGDIEDARAALRAVIARYEELCSGQPLPLVTDCGECSAFFKRAEQLFLQDPAWRPRAKAFAGAVRDSLEMVPAERGEFLLSGRADAALIKARISLHENAACAHWQYSACKARQTLAAAFGSNFVPLENADAPCGGEFGAPLFSPAAADRLLRAKISAIAAARADIVACGSHSSAAHIAAGLKKYYPHAKAVHYAVLIDEACGG